MGVVIFDSQLYLVFVLFRIYVCVDCVFDIEEDKYSKERHERIPHFILCFIFNKVWENYQMVQKNHKYCFIKHFNASSSPLKMRPTSGVIHDVKRCEEHQSQKLTNLVSEHYWYQRVNEPSNKKYWKKPSREHVSFNIYPRIEASKLINGSILTKIFFFLRKWKRR